MLRTRSKFVAAFVISTMLAGVVAGATLAFVKTRGAAEPPVAALDRAAHPATAQPGYAADLRQAVGRWNNERPSTAPGAPSNPVDLITGIGKASDTLTAFATDRGWVCYEVLAAGSCGRVDLTGGVTFSILSTRADGVRLYGVAADYVSAVEVETEDVWHPAVLRKNGFYYALPDGRQDSDVQFVRATWTDGSTHLVHVHG